MYFISLIYKDMKHVSCIGFVDTFKKADLFIKSHSYDFPNCRYAIVENVKEGIFMYDENPIFYSLTSNKQAQKLKNVPKEFKNKIGLGFGMKIEN
jgi:hypothetical protein|nr:MAG TPA: hypothetical protein [Caudoviricetes sp.]